MNELNVAVIGCGSWGQNHARVYSDLDNARLLAVCDKDTATASRLGARYRVDWYTDAMNVLKSDDIDAVSICTPTTTHACIAIAAIESGKHVLVEKPMTSTTEEAMRLIKAAENEGSCLSVGFVERFNPAVMEAKRMIERGVIGDIILARSTRVSRRPLRVGDIGVVKDLAIHEVDIINHIFGLEAASVYATAGNISHEFEDYANIIVRFGDDRNAFIEANWLTPRKVRSLILTGTEGMMTIQYQAQEVTVENDLRLYMPHIERQEPLHLELRQFVDSIRNGEPPQPSGWDGLRALEICEAALRSAKTGRPVTLRG
jgi:UDP-N-acetylglucosamine 3-dehydrogenase